MGRGDGMRANARCHAESSTGREEDPRHCSVRKVWSGAETVNPGLILCTDSQLSVIQWNRDKRKKISNILSKLSGSLFDNDSANESELKARLTNVAGNLLA